MINAYHRYDVLALSYVLKAREKGLYKPVFHCLCVKDSVIYATDGRRCHFSKVEDIKDGCYVLVGRQRSQILLAKLEEEVNFPDVKNILLDLTKLEAFELRNIDSEMKKYIKFIRHISDKFSIDVKFFNDAISNKAINKVYFDEEKKLFQFSNKDGNLGAIIAPIRMEL